MNLRRKSYQRRNSRKWSLADAADWGTRLSFRTLTVRLTVKQLLRLMQASWSRLDYLHSLLCRQSRILGYGRREFH